MTRNARQIILVCKDYFILRAERIYRHSQQDPTTLTLALVSIDDGEAVLKDVLIDGVSIKEIQRGILKNR